MTLEEMVAVLKKWWPYLRFDETTDVYTEMNIDASGYVTYMSVQRFDTPYYNMQKTNQPVELPDFDLEVIANGDDFYMSSLKFGSTRQAVFEVLGNPIKSLIGYEEYVGNYETCYFEKATVYFSGVTSYQDLSSGRAYTYVISDPTIIGPRGLQIGETIERIQDVFPVADGIDFKTLSEDTLMYPDPNDLINETNEAMIYPTPNKPYSGYVYLTVEWYKGIRFDYENGIITEISLTQMLD